MRVQDSIQWGIAPFSLLHMIILGWHCTLSTLIHFFINAGLYDNQFLRVLIRMFEMIWSNIYQDGEVGSTTQLKVHNKSTSQLKVIGLLFPGWIFLVPYYGFSRQNLLPCSTSFSVISDDEEREQLAKELSKDWNSGKFDPLKNYDSVAFRFPWRCLCAIPVSDFLSKCSL